MAVARFETLRSVAFGGISGTYAPIGAAFTTNIRIFCITNQTNGDLFISLSGTTDHMFIPANSFRLYDLSTNAPPISQNDNFELAQLTRFYVKQSTAPTSGSVYLEAIYARNS
jgi:hypothetical protein